MDNEVKTEEFCGIDIFNWTELNYIDEDIIQFYDVTFLLPSMVKYNGRDVAKSFSGRLEIYDDNGEIIWHGWITDIPEVMEELNKRICN